MTLRIVATVAMLPGRRLPKRVLACLPMTQDEEVR